MVSLESNKTLSGVGAIFVALGVALGIFIPFLGLFLYLPGIVLVLIGIKSLADYYNEPRIFQNALYGFFGGLFSRTMVSFLGLGFSLVYLILALVFSLLEAIFYKKSFNMIAQKSGEKRFDTAGMLLLIGAVLTIILIPIAWILVAVVFFSVKTAQPATLPPPPPPQPVLAKLICKYCGAENPLDSVYCKNCGSKIGGGGEPESAGTQVKPTDVDRELALLEEWLSKLEELYRKGEVEEDAYKKLKEEYETKKRELEETGLHS